ncbi:CENP-B homolog protein 1-like [Helianthus annuus]|uniref:CENP-B homolog protein 1-like n=1 Tax=Helianthus annuus TaxID=4232 RepID=UPI000B905F08|nr:CENP-B homolog protein 1-like [Helianthus annuus]
MQWVDKTFDFKVSQGTILNTLKRSSEFLSDNFDKDGSSKRHKAAKYPDMEKVVYEWFLQHQERVSITGELIIEKAVEALKFLYPQDSSEHKLSQGWLEKFKLRHGFNRIADSEKVVRSTHMPWRINWSL